MFLYFAVSLLSQGGGGTLSLPKNAQSSICKRKGVSARGFPGTSQSHTQEVATPSQMPGYSPRLSVSFLNHVELCNTSYTGN